MSRLSIIMSENYEINIDHNYIYIKHKNHANFYQIKLDDEGLVVDIDDNGDLVELFHCVNDEVLE